MIRIRARAAVGGKEVSWVLGASVAKAVRGQREELREWVELAPIRHPVGAASDRVARADVASLLTNIPTRLGFCYCWQVQRRSRADGAATSSFTGAPA